MNEQEHCAEDAFDAVGVEKQYVGVRQEPTIMQIIERLSQQPNLEAVQVIERLVALKERQEEREAERLFIEAMVAAQAEIPQIKKHADGQSGKFASLDDIDAILKPIMARHGLAMSFDEKLAPNDHREFTAILSHRAGHSATRTIILPVDKGGNKNGVQAVGSSGSYAHRYLYKRHFAIVEQGEDVNGADVVVITGEEAKDLTTQIQDVGGNLVAFLKHFKIQSLTELRKADKAEALQMIASKRKG